MNDESYTLFKRLATPEEADELIAILKENGIDSILNKASADLDTVFIGTSVTNQFEVKIKKEDFNQANDLLEKYSETLLDSIDPSYFLFSFNDEELMEVLTKPHEWSELDFVLSKKILKDRNVDVDFQQIQEDQNTHLEELAKPEGGQLGWIIFGYICAVFGGFFGLPIGYFIWKAKKTLPDGTKMPAYNETVRKHGLVIFVISAIVFPITLLIRVFGEVLI